jgi:enoyl-CoA hydratase/carnithine racemase
VEKQTEKLLRTLAQNAPLSLRATKKILSRLGATLTSEEHATFTAERLEISRSSDLQEGLKAFFEKRVPNFTGS